MMLPAPDHHMPQAIPSNLYTPKNPGRARLVGNTRLTPDGSPNDVRHLVLDLSQTDLHYLPGQSLGILVPGMTEAGAPHKLRLYSIASPRTGEDGTGKTVALCVKRALWPTEDGSIHHGVCSNYLCDREAGSELTVTGPVGKSFLLPADPSANFIFLATGTGIAPFRGFLKTLYRPGSDWHGQVHLLFGAQHQIDFLYAHELLSLQNEQSGSFELITAFSREETTAAGERCYIQHKLASQAQQIVPLLQQLNTYLYMCGLKGMEHGIAQALEAAFSAQGLSWDDQYARLKTEKRWHVEVY